MFRRQISQLTAEMYRKINYYCWWRLIVTCVCVLVILRLLTVKNINVYPFREMRHIRNSCFLCKTGSVNYFNAVINNASRVEYKENEAGSLLKVQRQTTPKQTNDQTESAGIFDYNFSGTDKLLKTWERHSNQYCQSKVTGYSNMFIRLQDVIVDPGKIAGPVGDEKLSETLGQKEFTEFLQITPGLFVLPCDKVPEYNIARYMSSSSGHIPRYLKGSIATAIKYNKTMASQVDAFTIVVTRYDYANLFHALNDIFNVFLMHILFHKDPKDTLVVIADGHPRGHIDPMWQRLFGDVKRIRQLNSTLIVKNMVWNMYEKFCPLNNHELDHIPHQSDFRNFVLDKYSINHKSNAECSNRMRVLFIWRRDYLAHPRNPSGKIDRKIKNEDEILSHMQKLHSKFDIKGVDFANLSLGDQLSEVANADIIVGMHGAGLTHILFMPDKGGIIELWPFDNPVKNLKAKLVFENMARWKNSTIIKWHNKNKKYNLQDGFTHIPPTIIQTLFDKLLQNMCS